MSSQPTPENAAAAPAAASAQAAESAQATKPSARVRKAASAKPEAPRASTAIKTAAKTAAVKPAAATKAALKAKPAVKPAAKAVSAKPASAPAAKDKEKEKKAKKPKLVRDSFTIPKDEYAAIEQLKTRALKQGVAVKKSELLRAGLLALVAQNDAALLKTIRAVPTVKTGRPSKAG